jgi:hypothetical protein
MLPGKARRQVILPCLLNYILPGNLQWVQAYLKNHRALLRNIRSSTGSFKIDIETSIAIKASNFLNIKMLLV